MVSLVYTQRMYVQIHTYLYYRWAWSAAAAAAAGLGLTTKPGICLSCVQYANMVGRNIIKRGIGLIRT